jgi:hypothetical protein
MAMSCWQFDLSHVHDYRSDGKVAAMMTQTQLVLPREPSALAG